MTNDLRSLSFQRYFCIRLVSYISTTCHCTFIFIFISTTCHCLPRQKSMTSTRTCLSWLLTHGVKSILSYTQPSLTES